MPYILSENSCKKCGKSHVEFRSRYNHSNKKYYLQTTCKACERLATKKHQRDNPDYWRTLNKKAYRNISDISLERKRVAAHLRHKRLHPVSWDREFTDFVTEEAHSLRKIRNKLFTFKWHVDHIIPLHGEQVSGLHVWNNLSVIPAIQNLSKKNKYQIGGT